MSNNKFSENSHNVNKLKIIIHYLSVSSPAELALIYFFLFQFSIEGIRGFEAEAVICVLHSAFVYIVIQIYELLIWLEMIRILNLLFICLVIFIYNSIIILHQTYQLILQFFWLNLSSIHVILEVQ